MDIIRRRKTRQVRKDLVGEVPKDSLYSHREEASAKPKKPRKAWKWVLIVFGALVSIGLLSLLGGYLYVKAAPLQGENTGRINVMVLGVDQAATLSDTIMIASIDTRVGHEHKLSMISLPRDMYVTIPEFGNQKINAAYSLGENNDHPGGGPALAAATIEETFGQPIHYYAVINFNGFKKIIDTVGGVDIKINQDLQDLQYPNSDYSGYEPFSIEAGNHHLDGQTALKIARCRKGTCGNDYGRAARQQQIILAVKDKVLSIDTLLSPSKLNKLQDISEKNIKTSLSLRQLAKLYLIFRKIAPENINRHVIDTSNYLTSSGYSSALVPRTGNFDEISNFIDNIFKENKDTLPEDQS